MSPVSRGSVEVLGGYRGRQEGRGRRTDVQRVPAVHDRSDVEAQSRGDLVNVLPEYRFADGGLAGIVKSTTCRRASVHFDRSRTRATAGRTASTPGLASPSNGSSE
jgi:hypothetical protein